MKHFPSFQLPSFCLCVLLFACLQNQELGDKLGSTSVTTGNPTGLKISFKRNSLAMIINGHIDIYAATQIPVKGFEPDPLATFPLVNAKEVLLTPFLFDSIPDSLWSKTSMEGDSIYRFNVVTVGDSIGSILRGFAFNKSTRDFIPGSLVSSVAKGKYAEVDNELGSLIPYVGKLDTNAMSSLWDYYLFIYGTGFVAKANHGLFSFSQLPAAPQDCFLILLPGREHQLSGLDSTTVFGLNAPVFATSSDSLHIGSTKDRLELPDSLKTK